MGVLFSYQHFDVTQSIIHDMEREHAVLLNRMIETAKSDQLEGIRDAERYHRQTLNNISEMRTVVLFSVAAMVVVLVFSVVMLNGYVMRRQLEHMQKALRKGLEGEGGARVGVQENDVCGELAVTINMVLSRLEQLRTELDRRHVDQAAYTEKMVSLGEVAATVAHEIKNPLAGISGALQVLAEEYSETNPRREIANDVLNEIDRLDKSIKDLLLFARPPELNLILTDIHAIIDKIKHVLAASAEERGIRIRTEYGAVPEMLLDPDQIEKALLNIGTHLVNAMRPGGGLTITTSYNPDKGEAEIILSDTAGVMEEEALKHIFKPSFSSKNLGAGFRLAISRNIVETHKGRLLAESVAGAGIRFRVIIPHVR